MSHLPSLASNSYTLRLHVTKYSRALHRDHLCSSLALYQGIKVTFCSVATLGLHMSTLTRLNAVDCELSGKLSCFLTRTLNVVFAYSFILTRSTGWDVLVTNVPRQTVRIVRCFCFNQHSDKAPLVARGSSEVACS